MNNLTLPNATHTDCSHQYGADAGAGAATMTIAFFVMFGVVHKVIRFWRHDYLKTGSIEIYTLEPYSAEHTSCTELGWYTYTGGDFFRYVDEANPSRVDMAAMEAIHAASKGAYTNLHLEQVARYAAMEF